LNYSFFTFDKIKLVKDADLYMLDKEVASRVFVPIV